jgi:hypothetical protein
VPRPRKVPDSLQQIIKYSLFWRPVQELSLTNSGLQGLIDSFSPLLPAPSTQLSQHRLTPDTQAGDDFMATGPGPKGQESGPIPGCEVAWWGLAQALVWDLHCEESQPSRLVWNLSIPGDQAERLFSSWGLLSLPTPWQAQDNT